MMAGINRFRMFWDVNATKQLPEFVLCPGTIPHSLRGMALGQLQHLETLFVKTGWLAGKCESFNTENAQAIANGTRFKQGPNLYALDTFVVTPMTKPGFVKHEKWIVRIRSQKQPGCHRSQSW